MPLMTECGSCLTFHEPDEGCPEDRVSIIKELRAEIERLKSQNSQELYQEMKLTIENLMWEKDEYYKENTELRGKLRKAEEEINELKGRAQDRFYEDLERSERE